MESLIGLVAVSGFWVFLIICVLSGRSRKQWKEMSKAGWSMPMAPGAAGGASEVTQMLDEVRRMEERVRTLERILDADHPGWRNKL